MAGDCANAVTEEGDEDSESLVNGILCMQDLRWTLIQVSSINTWRYVPSTNVPQLQTSVIAPDEDFVQIGGGMKKVYSDKSGLEMNLAM
jgi:hypothetical protein